MMAQEGEIAGVQAHLFSLSLFSFFLPHVVGDIQVVHSRTLKYRANASLE
jgi:hypothetical protein